MLCTAPASAQVQPLTKWIGGPFNVTVVNPTQQSDGGRIDCAPRTAGCKPLNLARCTDDTPMRINFVVAPGASGLPAYSGTTQALYAFLSATPGCIYSRLNGQTGYTPDLLIGTTSSLAGSAPFFAGGTQSFRFPTGVSTFNANMTKAGSTGEFTVGEMLNALGVCPPNQPVQMGTYFLCVGVDVTNSQGINNTSTASTATTTTAPGGATSSADPVTYLQFQIDTQPPEAPIITEVHSLNGRCNLSVNYTSPSLDVYTVRVKYSKNASNLNVACNLWTDDIEWTAPQTVNGQSGGTLKFTAQGLDNDITYAFCAEAEDYMQNVSPPSSVVTGQPRFECDIFACSPEPLRTGYCSQYAAPQLWLGALVTLGLRRLRRRGGAR